MQAEVIEVFEREVAALSGDPAFPGLEILAHAARRSRSAIVLRLTVDRPGGVDTSLCERISARLNAALERCAEPYTLEVASAGLERPLLRPHDYQRFAGHAVRVTTSLPISGAKTHRGVLRGVRGDLALLETGRGELPIPLVAITAAHLEYDPRADLQREKRERKRHA